MRCLRSWVGHWHTVSDQERQFQKLLEPWKEAGFVELTLSTQVGTGIGSAGSKIRWTLATLRKLESSQRNRRVGARYWIDLQRRRW